MANYDVIIVGAGPAGIFTALEMLRKGSKKKVLIVEKGVSVEKRACPKAKTKVCMNCKPYCHITTGFSGAGAFSDGKLSLSCEVGGNLPELIGEELAQATIDYTDKIYLEFGADPHVEGVSDPEKIREIRKKAINANLKLVDCPIRHLGTEMAHQLYLRIEKYLIEHGVDIIFSTRCEDIIIENDVCTGVVVTDNNGCDRREIRASSVVIATGRKGADWLERTCESHSIAHQPGTVDIGVRVEVRNEVMEEVNEVLYESKLIGYPLPFKNKVRTFCQNPGGFVSQENYDNDLAVVNGHSYKDLKSNNTNTSQFSVRIISAFRSISRLSTRKRSASLQICSETGILWFSATAIFSTENAHGRRSFLSPTSSLRFRTRLRGISQPRCHIAR